MPAYLAWVTSRGIRSLRRRGVCFCRSRLPPFGVHSATALYVCYDGESIGGSREGVRQSFARPSGGRPLGPQERSAPGMVRCRAPGLLRPRAPRPAIYCRPPRPRPGCRRRAFCVRNAGPGLGHVPAPAPILPGPANARQPSAVAASVPSPGVRPGDHTTQHSANSTTD